MKDWVLTLAAHNSHSSNRAKKASSSCHFTHFASGRMAADALAQPSAREFIHQHLMFRAN